MNINLEELKASGVYTFEFDASQTLSETNEYGRLAIGSSKKGTFNTIVKIKDDPMKIAIYGQNDRLLEKKGSFLHKSLEVMLREGSAYALNVLPVDLVEDNISDEYINQDRAFLGTINTESSDTSNEPIDIPVMNLFNKQKLWYASDVEVNRTKNRKMSDKNDILTFANISQKQVTIFVQKSNQLGFDITVDEWYSSIGPDVIIPGFLHKDDLISDYLVNVIVIDGDWTNYRKLSTDPIYSKYFDSSGLKTENLSEFLKLRTTNTLVNVYGSLIPDFKDSNDNVMSIDRIFNNLYPTTQIICSLDSDKLDEIDLSEDTYNEETMSTRRIDIIGNGIDDLVGGIIDTISYKSPLTKTTLHQITNDDVVNLQSIMSESTIGSPSFTQIRAYENSSLYKLWNIGYLNSGDYLDQTPDIYIKIKQGSDSIGKFIIIEGYSDQILLEKIDLIDLSDSEISITSSNQDFKDYEKTIDLSNFDSYEQLSPNKLKIEITNLSDIGKDELFNYIKVGSYLNADISSGRKRIMRIMSVSTQREFDPDKTFITIEVKASTSDEVLGIDVTDNKIIAYIGIHNFIKSLSGLKLKPFKIREQLLPNGTSTRQNEILKFLFDTNIAASLTQSEAIDIRYIVDTYEGEISTQSKYYLSRLAAIHGKCATFTNTPSMKQFENNIDPLFIDAITGLIRTEYIADGGNLSLNPSFTYKFASDTVNGVPIESYTLPSFPNLRIRENGVERSMIPAPYVSNAYIRKFKANAPYVIVAGQAGRITDPDVIGVEYELTDEDRALLEPKGYNLLVHKRRGGVMLFTNNTAYQTVKSALNNAHVRDTLITLEKNIESILYNFLFRFNTPILRVRVKNLVDSYLEGVQFNGGLAWFDTQIDENNNDAYVLENNSAVIDILVDFNRGIHKFVNKITITRVGGRLSITQSGFQSN